MLLIYLKPTVRSIILYCMNNQETTWLLVQSIRQTNGLQSIGLDVFAMDEIIALVENRGYPANYGEFSYIVFGGSARMLEAFLQALLDNPVKEARCIHDITNLLKEYFDHSNKWTADDSDYDTLITAAAMVFVKFPELLCCTDSNSDPNAFATVESMFFHYCSDGGDSLLRKRYARKFAKYVMEKSSKNENCFSMSLQRSKRSLHGDSLSSEML